MSQPRSPETVDHEPRARRRWPLLALAVFVYAVFYLAEPQDWRFSISPAMRLDSNDETISARIQENIARQEAGSNQRRAGVALLGCYGVVCLLRPGDQRLRLHGLLGWSILAFLAWSVLSVLWSIDPPITVKRLLVLGLQCAAALGLAKQLKLEDFIQLTLWVTGFLAFGGLCCELALGSFLPWGDEYRFSGLTWPAFTCWNVSLFVIALLSLRGAGRRWLRVAGVALAVALALLTKTRTGAAALVLAMAMRASAAWSATAKVLVTCGACFVCSCGLLALSFTDTDPLRLFVRSVNLGRERSAEGFSGRAGVWSMLLPYMLERPFRGYGYETFWTTAHLREIGERNWGAPDAHNGYINLTLGVGAVGASLFALVLALAVLRSRRQFLQSWNADDLFPGCVVLITAVNTLSVATQLNPYLMSFVSMVALARLAFVEEAQPAASQRAETNPESSAVSGWRPAESAARPA